MRSPRARALSLTPSCHPPSFHSYDIKFVQAQADEIEQLAEQKEKSKPLFLLYKNGGEVARMVGANAMELQRQVTKHAKKKP